MGKLLAALVVVCMLVTSAAALAVPKAPSSVYIDGPYLVAFNAEFHDRSQCLVAVQYLRAWHRDDESKATLGLLASVWYDCYWQIVAKNRMSDARFVPIYFVEAYCYGLYAHRYDTAAHHLTACNPLY